MANPKTRLLAVGTATCAFAIGYVMQFGMPFSSGPTGPIEVTGIVDTAAPVDAEAPSLQTSAATGMAGLVLPEMPGDAAARAVLPDAVVEFAAVDTGTTSDATLPAEAARSGFDCDIAATAEPTAGALVSLAITAPCHGSERLTVHHSGMMFTATMQPDGSLALVVPALSEQAVFILSYASGDGAVVQTQVSSLAFYDRVALQWRDQSGLQLHAREMGADYFAEGHVWSGARGSIEAAARGEGGFLTRLGDADAPEPLLAEIYSFPAGTARVNGDIALTVEAEVTAANCAGDVEAQMLQLRTGSSLTVQDLTLSMPECDAVGDFLVLDEMVRDIEVAAR
ncbi:translocase [Roseivivax sp. CAU 1753]